MIFNQSISINKAVTVVPILILIIVGVLQGVDRYYDDIEKAIANRVELAKVSAQPIINLMNRSVGGGNYANIQDAEALNLFQANKAIEFFSVSGKTDQQNTPFGAMYDAQSGKIYRTLFADDYISSRQAKLTKIAATLAKLPPDHKKRTKLEKIKNRLNSEISNYEKQKQIAAQLSNKYQKPAIEQVHDQYYIDFEQGLLYLVVPLKNKGGGELWMVQDISGIKQLWKNILYDILPPLSVLLIVSIFVVLYLAGSINKPLANMIEKVHAIEQNSDLSQRIESSNVAELNHLATVFNSMLEKFQRIIADASHVSLTTTEAAEKMADISRKGSQFMHQQQEQINVVDQAMKDMLNAVEHVTDNINQAASVAEDTRNSAQKGCAVVNTSIGKINQVSRAVANASEATAKVASSVENISSIVGVIKGIAEQTNLLALNAAIEAARAGEQGRGFAVVADEVRTLANQTQESTDQIQQMIEQLQSASTAVITQMDAGNEQVKETIKQASEAGTSLEHITEAVNGLFSMNKTIAEQSERQLELVETIKNTLESIKDITDKNNNNAEQAASLGQNLESSSEKLEDIVGQFKV